MDSREYQKTLEAFYKYQSWVFKAFALWQLPDNVSHKYRLMHSIHFWHMLSFWVLLLDFSLLIQVISKISDLNEVIKVFFVFATALAVFPKFITVKLRNKLYQQMVDTIHDEDFKPRNLREEKLYMKSVNLARTVRNAYVIISLLALHMVMVSQLIVGNWELPVSAYIPFSLEKTSVYIATYVYQYLSVSLCCYINIAFESISTAFLIHMMGHLDILKDRLENLGQNEFKDQQNTTEDLKDCIIFYTRIISNARNIEKMISIPISVQIFCSVLVLVANFYAISFLSDPGDYVNFAKFAVYQVCMLSQIFILCFYCNEVTLKSAKLSFAIYSSNWINFNKTNRQLIMLMMLRFDMPLRIRAINRNYAFTLEAFTTIVNSSYSYFALLKRING